MASPNPLSDRVTRRASVITRHLLQHPPPSTTLRPSICVEYTPPDPSSPSDFDTVELRRILDGHHVADRDWVFGLMRESRLFCPRRIGRSDTVFVSPDYNQSMEQQREATMRRVEYLSSRGVFEGWLTRDDPEMEMRKFAAFECIGIYDHSLAVKLGVHFFLWGGAIRFFGTKRHHDKWLKDTEDYVIKGCFAMTELGHGSNVRGIETVATYDRSTEEFVINTPCESAQKYWIGGAAKHATHTIVFAQLYIDGANQGVHAFIAQIRDANGNVCPNIRIADCGHKIGLNGVDNGRIWFDYLRVPRENLLNSVADVTPDGQYVSAIKDPDQRFAAFLAPLTSGRVNIAVSTICISKIGLGVAVRYALTRRAFSIAPNSPEVLLLDYPSHQRRLLPLIAKTCVMSCSGNYLKRIYVKKTPEANKMIHIYSSAFKAMFTWHNMRTLQECREACGGQGLKTENRVGSLISEFDVHSTFEGDNHILLQQISKALLGEYLAVQLKKRPFKGLGLEHMNGPYPVIPDNLTSSVLRSSEFQSYQVAEDLARAFSERVIFQIFLDTEASFPAGPLKKLFGLLRSMYALVSLEEDSVFLRYGYLSPSNVAIVIKEVANLCSELRPHALSLVESFGIPDAFLSPLAFNWIEANSWSSVQQQQ
ncbi:Acyl-coenzyme A oxidase 3, peroxisomal [Acorus gramineus]|uniref:Acyl-coenzyme A oxidase n=1 Tax=Acorus gramineus TaxID=55184 RepID=A0AAV9BGY6_ACOGR|nr:Acyl-coenzyme A oxidase 3, peroxisomal [Acorus gramineus]